MEVIPKLSLTHQDKLRKSWGEKQRRGVPVQRERERERTERKRLSLRNKQIQLEIIVRPNAIYCDSLIIEKSRRFAYFFIIFLLSKSKLALYKLRRDIIPKENENRDLVGLVTSWGSSNNHSSLVITRCIFVLQVARLT